MAMGLFFVRIRQEFVELTLDEGWVKADDASRAATARDARDEDRDANDEQHEQDEED